MSFLENFKVSTRWKFRWATVFVDVLTADFYQFDVCKKSVLPLSNNSKLCNLTTFDHLHHYDVISWNFSSFNTLENEFSNSLQLISIRYMSVKNPFYLWAIRAENWSVRFWQAGQEFFVHSMFLTLMPMTSVPPGRFRNHIFAQITPLFPDPICNQKLRACQWT